MGGSRGRRAPSAANLSCGAGGLACGSAKAGLRAAAGIGTDESRGYALGAGTRSRFACKPVKDAVARARRLASAGRERARGKRALIGCAPRRPFFRYGRSRAADAERSLPGAFYRLVRGTFPHAVSTENVSPTRLRPHTAFGKFARRLRGEGYRAWHSAVKCPGYGVPLPPARRRLALPVPGLGGIGMIDGSRFGRPSAARHAVGDLDNTGRMPPHPPRGSSPQGARAVRGQPSAHAAGPAVGRLEEGPGRLAGVPVPPKKAGEIERQRVRPAVAGPAVARDDRAGRSARDRAARPSRSGQGLVAQRGSAGPDTPARLRARGRKEWHAKRSGGRARRERSARRPREGGRPGHKAAPSGGA